MLSRLTALWRAWFAAGSIEWHRRRCRPGTVSVVWAGVGGYAVWCQHCQHEYLWRCVGKILEGRDENRPR